MANQPQPVNYPTGSYPPNKVEQYSPAPYPYPAQQGQPSYPINQVGGVSYPGQIGANPYPNQMGFSPFPGQGNPVPYSGQIGDAPYPGQQNYPASSPNISPSHIPYPPDQPGSIQVQSSQLGTAQMEMPETDKPSAPPLNLMDRVPGYEGISFDSGFAPPPTYEDAIKEPTNRSQNIDLPTLSEEEAREALLGYLSEHCCYGKGAARTMRFTNLELTSNFKYILETFTEKRSTAWDSTAFDGNPVDGPMNGVAPGPWEISVSPPGLFEVKTTDLEVPHTASVKQCHICLGIGRVVCKKCHGRGSNACSFCRGSGRSTFKNNSGGYDQCSHCKGSGHDRCFTCSGNGQTTCKTCTGRGQLKCYIKLTVIWSTYKDDEIVQKTTLAESELRKASGKTAFKEEQVRVFPVNNFPINDINLASNKLIQQHATQYAQERIIMQRQTIEVIPATQVHYIWKEKEGMFYVTGIKSLVYFPDYPQRCCWGCTLL